MNKFISDTLTVAQIPQHVLTAQLFTRLRKKADFRDTDKSLDEFFVSLHNLIEVTEAPEEAIATEAKMLLDEVNDVNASYIQIIDMKKGAHNG